MKVEKFKVLLYLKKSEGVKAVERNAPRKKNGGL